MNPESPTVSIAIVGAGIAGLVAARHLRDVGHDVHVFDKARGPGGRMSTRYEHGYEFDHGAQYFTVRHESFREAVDRWRERGLVGPWTGRIVDLGAEGIPIDREPIERFVAVPRMNALCRDLADSLTVTLHTPVSGIARANTAWTLSSDGEGKLGRFDRVIVTTPPAQAIPLLADAPELAEEAASARMLPCWAVMVAFDRDLDIAWDGAFVCDSPLAWVARNSSKPGRPAGETWVLHGSPEWSEARMESDPSQVGDALVTALFEATRVRRAEPVSRSVHRWRYARTAAPLTAGYLHDPELGVGVCGDWCQGNRVEDAFVSGLALASRIGVV